MHRDVRLLCIRLPPLVEYKETRSLGVPYKFIIGFGPSFRVGETKAEIKLYLQSPLQVERKLANREFQRHNYQSSLPDMFSEIRVHKTAIFIIYIYVCARNISIGVLKSFLSPNHLNWEEGKRRESP